MKSLEDLAFGELNVFPRVAQREFVVSGQTRWNGDKVKPAQRPYCGVESRGLLGMLRTRYMFFANWIRSKPGHYLPNSNRPNEPGTTLRGGRPLVSPAGRGRN